jgi:hypothetical protein
MTRSVILKRVVISMLVGLLLGVAISEISFDLLNNGQTRSPKVVELVIPPGTGARVARGEADSTLPSSMVFVVGDTLLVKNEDSIPHQLGPLFIPPGSSTSMNLNLEQDYAFVCSFQPSKYLGLSVQSPLNLTTRIVGILEAGLNLGFLIALYAVFAMPPKKQVAA